MFKFLIWAIFGLYLYSKWPKTKLVQILDRWLWFRLFVQKTRWNLYAKLHKILDTFWAKLRHANLSTSLDQFKKNYIKQLSLLYNFRTLGSIKVSGNWTGPKCPKTKISDLGQPLLCRLNFTFSSLRTITSFSLNQGKNLEESWK